MRNYEEPTVKTESDREQVVTHPAFGQIRASRVSGQSVLYGSDFIHHHYVIVEITRSKLRRSLSNDWHHSSDELIRVALSEAQWAHFVSAMNMGGGTPCTFQHINRESVPQIPDPPERTEQFTQEARVRLDEVIKAVDALNAKIDALKVSEKVKQDLRAAGATVRQELFSDHSGLAFIAKQFGEHVETVTEHAKVEVTAYVQNVITRAGLKAIQAAGEAKAPFLLPGEVRVKCDGNHGGGFCGDPECWHGPPMK